MNAIFIKPPRFTEGDFMPSPLPLSPLPPSAADFVDVITSKKLFQFLSFLAGMMALTYRLPDYFLVDFHCDLDFEFSRSNMEFAISQPKMVWLLRNEKQTYWLNFRPQMWPSDLTLAMTLTLNFQGQRWNLLYLSQKWSDCYETKKPPCRLNSRSQIWLIGLTLAMTLI